MKVYVILVLLRRMFLFVSVFGLNVLFENARTEVNAHIDSLVQDWSSSIAKALESLQSYTKPSIYASSVIRGCHHTNSKGRTLLPNFAAGETLSTLPELILEKIC